MLRSRTIMLARCATLLAWSACMAACGSTYADPIYDPGRPDAGSNDVASTDGAADAASWQVVFQDDFSAIAIDQTLWNTDWWWGRIKPDDASYFADNGATFADGMVSLQISHTPNMGLQYTSAVITTYQKFSFRYGRVEVRAKCPHLGNLVVDLLAASTAWPPEIGVVASDMFRPDRVYLWMTPSEPVDAGATSNDASGTGVGSADLGQQPSFYSGPDFSADFHIFEGEWSPGLVVWKVDGVERYRLAKGVPAEDMYVALAVQMDRAAMPTNPGPSDAEIDYVRIYQQK